MKKVSSILKFSMVHQNNCWGGVSLCGWSPVQQDLTEKENVLLFVSSEAVESYPVKLEKSHTVMLPPTVSVLWYVHQNNHLPIFNEF